MNLACNIIQNDLGYYVLIFGGITTGIQSGLQQIKIKNVYNPFFDGITGTFLLETMEPFVNTVIEQYVITGTQIDPGQISNIDISGSPLNLNLQIMYTITF